MAKRRVRARSGRLDASRGRAMRSAGAGDGVVSVIPRVLVGAVNGVEIVAVGALQFARDVLLSTVSGAANIGAEALSATTAGARGVVSAASRMVGDIATTAEGTFRDTVYNATHSRPGAGRVALSRFAAITGGGQDDETTTAVPAPEARSRRRTRRQRPAGTRAAA